MASHLTGRAEYAAVCNTVVAALPVDGAACTVMSSDVVRETLCASDAVMAEIEQLQFSLGEGPVLDAFTTGRPVLIPHLGAASSSGRWPVFAPAAAELDVGGLFAFPMRLGAITVGVCEMYRITQGPLLVSELARVLRTVDLATLSMLALRAGEPADPGDDGWLDGHSSARQQVHQATGMLIGQLGVPAEEAFARLRAHAFAEGRDIDELAADIVARRLRLDPT